MGHSFLDAVVIGAGHAGLCLSKFLSDHGLAHLVFEKGKIGETWRSQRWNSFKLNSYNKINLLSGQTFSFQDEDAFPSAQDFVAQLEDYTQQFNLPVVENAAVTSVEKDTANDCFTIAVSTNGMTKNFYSRQVVVASGAQNKPVVPPFAQNIDPSVVQVHAGSYRSAAQLPEGAVLVVGSAQSGTQIAEDLANAGRTVFLSTCKVGRIPRTYRGRDIFDWLFEMGLYDVRREEATVELLRTRPPQVSGVGIRGKTCSLQSLAKAGATILGKIENADDDTVHLQSNAAEHVLFADAFSQKLKASVDDHILKNKLTVPLPEQDPNDLPNATASCASSITTLSLKDKHITSIIWATGFTGDFAYLKLPVFNKDKTLSHRDGVSEIEGLYFLGLPWLRKRKSGIIYGAAEDAAFIAEQALQFGERFKQAAVTTSSAANPT